MGAASACLWYQGSQNTGVTLSLSWASGIHLSVSPQGRLTGLGGEDLPTIVIVAHYDAFGVAPVSTLLHTTEAQRAVAANGPWHRLGGCKGGPRPALEYLSHCLLLSRHHDYGS